MQPSTRIKCTIKNNNKQTNKKIDMVSGLLKHSQQKYFLIIYFSYQFSKIEIVTGITARLYGLKQLLIQTLIWEFSKWAYGINCKITQAWLLSILLIKYMSFFFLFTFCVVLQLIQHSIQYIMEIISKFSLFCTD